MRKPLSIALLLSLALPTAAAESRELYVKGGTNAAAWEKGLAPLRAAEPQVEYRVVELPEHAGNPADAKTRARAMEAGVTVLPSLVLRDEQGAYATLPFIGLTVKQLEEARQLANAPQREESASRRRFDAQCYLLCARISQADISDEALATAVEECRLLLQHATATDADRQFLGLRCLYPLLMLRYTREYSGAHSPQTEARLLEAIAALEAARDLDRETKLGKEAFAERERLRAARREARKYE